MTPLIALLLMGTAPAPLDAAPQGRLDPALRCLIGSYDLPGGQSITITGEDGQPRRLHYILSAGESAALTETGDGRFVAGALAIRFQPCATGTLSLSRAGGTLVGRRVPLVERPVRFTSDGVSLHGKLVLPVGGRARQAAVWIEGSNNDPSTDDSPWPYELARRGVATLVYDKRGTGASGGATSSDFAIRARDTAAALAVLRQQVPGLRQVGVIGGSQGGWVAPLVAAQVQVDFVIPAFALAESPIAQDQALVEQQLSAAGHDAAALAEARQLTAITERIVRSNLADGLDDLDRFKAAHSGAAWLAAIQPRSYTGLFLQFPSDVIRSAGPAMAQGLRFDFEPLPLIETIKARQLWLLAGQDHQAPSTNTQAILRRVQTRRSDLWVVVYPDADHGLIGPVSTPDGIGRGYPPGLFDLMAGWIRGRAPPRPFTTMPGQSGRS